MGGSGVGMDGMELARNIRAVDIGRQPIIVFVTGYEKYVYDAFDVGAFQYLVKPVDEKKFAAVVDATHPFAKEVTNNIKLAVDRQNAFGNPVR